MRSVMSSIVPSPSKVKTSVFDFRTGYTRNFTLNGLINDSLRIDGATAVILDNELYVCSTPGPEISDGFIKSSLDNFLDLYVKD